MAKEKVVIGQESDGKPAQAAETFTVTLSNGSVIVAGKAPGVLKLRLLRLLPEDVRRDPEMMSLATAFCGIRTFDGHPPALLNAGHFEALLQRFPSDEDVDAFANAYRRFVDPESMEVVEKALAEGAKQGLVGDALLAHVQTKMFEYQKKVSQKVRD